jgi:hypothetical protein
MLGRAMDLTQEEQYDVRPPKRPRNISLPEELPPTLRPDPRLAPEEMGMGSPVAPDPSRSSRFEALPFPGSSASRALRGEDKNPRTLSCKECRRYNLSRFSVVLLKSMSLHHARLKLKVRSIILYFGY